MPVVGSTIVWDTCCNITSPSHRSHTHVSQLISDQIEMLSDPKSIGTVVLCYDARSLIQYPSNLTIRVRYCNSAFRRFGSTPWRRDLSCRSLEARSCRHGGRGLGIPTDRRWRVVVCHADKCSWAAAWGGASAGRGGGNHDPPILPPRPSLRPPLLRLPPKIRSMPSQIEMLKLNPISTSGLDSMPRR